MKALEADPTLDITGMAVAMQKQALNCHISQNKPFTIENTFWFGPSPASRVRLLMQVV